MVPPRPGRPGLRPKTRSASGTCQASRSPDHLASVAAMSRDSSGGGLALDSWSRNSRSEAIMLP
jgi:hypothetical protein